jgi:hypothetical protein
MAVAENQEVTTTATRVVTGTGQAGAPMGVGIKAPSSNTQTVYIGGEDVDSTDGFPLTPGDSIAVDLLAGEQLWVVAASGTQALNVIATRNQGAL